MNNNYTNLILKLNKLKGLYLKRVEETDKSKEEKLSILHTPKIVEFYERNKSKELLYFLLKSQNTLDIDTLLTKSQYIANQTSSKRRKLISRACLKGLGNDYAALYVISNQKTIKEMRELISIYFSHRKDREELLEEAKKMTLKRIYNRY